MNDRDRFLEILKDLEIEYPDTPSLLNHSSPFELLIGVILSAQTTDNAVNTVLPVLFERYPDAAKLASAELAEVEEIIHSLGFFRSKARHIVGAARAIAEEWGGEIPSTMDDLVRLPGVGRKSAGVILLHVFDTPAIIVDTHFGRVVRRLGFSTHKNPQILERDVASILPADKWNGASMRLNYHGRRYCHARKPDCKACPISRNCPSAQC